MTKKLVIITMLGMILLAPATLSALWWQNAEIGISLDKYGRIRTYTEPADENQLQRFTILVGTGNDAVFSYNEDANNIDTAVAVIEPEYGDWEGKARYDYTYSYEPPEVEVGINVYGWNTGEFALLKYNVKNISSSSMTAKLGFEFLNEINYEVSESYVNNIHYFSDDKIAAATAPDTTIYVGVKLLSSDITSLSSINYFSGYDSDSLLWANLNKTTIENEFLSNADGPVAFIGGPTVTLGVDETTDLWVAIAQGNTEAEMVASMNEATTKYSAVMSTGEGQDLQPEKLSLTQNFPNPFNPETVIEFALPGNDFVTLDVYDIQGKLVSSLVKRNLPAGHHSVVFNGVNLPSGMYFYRLNTAEGTLSRKMLLLK